MSKALPLLFLKGVAKGGHKLAQFFSMAAQEFPHILDILQTVRSRNSTQLLCKRWRKRNRIKTLVQQTIHLHYSFSTWSGMLQQVVNKWLNVLIVNLNWWCKSVIAFNDCQITRAVFSIKGPRNAQYAVGLLLLIVERLLKQDGDGGGIGKPCTQPDLVIVYRHFLEDPSHKTAVRLQTASRNSILMIELQWDITYLSI